MNRRRIMLSILLSCLMILTTLTPVFAADSNNINDSDSKTIGEVSKKTMAASARSVGDTFEDTFEKDGKTFTITYVVTDASANEVSFALKNDPTTNIKELSGMYEIPSSVTYNGTEYTVTSIADNAFYKWSFSEQINTKCTYIIIPDTIIKIGANAFEQNTNLKSIYIPDSVTSIGESAFSGCYNAKKLRFSRNLTALPDYAFFNIRVDNLVIPGNIKTIGSNMIRNEWLESVKVLEGVESIASKSFMNWNNTTREVELPASLTSLDSGFIDNRLNSTDAKLTIHSPSLNIDFTKPLAYVNSGTVYGHSGSAGSPSQVKQNFDANQFSYSGVSFSTEGVCHSNNVKSRTEPTCGEDGSVTYEAGTCDCGNTNVPETTIALSATGLHDCSWKITKEPTCTAKGTKVFKCDTCGDVFIEPIEIPATGVHDYSVEVTEKAASCTENGLKYMK